jgi:hypothetical protein
VSIHRNLLFILVDSRNRKQLLYILINSCRFIENYFLFQMDTRNIEIIAYYHKFVLILRKLLSQ